MSLDHDNFEQPDEGVEHQEHQEQQPEHAEDQGKHDKAAQEKKYQLKDIDQTSVFINNLEENTTEDDLKDYFRDCGTIEKVTIRNDKNTGFLYAYIQFQDKSAVEDAIMLSDGMLRGKKIKVYEKRTNLRSFGRRTTRGRAMRPTFRGRYTYNPTPRGRGRGGFNKFGQ